MELIMALVHYFSIVCTDGDWLNDWLTHMPHAIRQAVEAVGRAMADSQAC
jgi:hypothetical protein